MQKFHSADQILAGVAEGNPQAIARAHHQAANPNVGVYNTNRFLKAIADHEATLVTTPTVAAAPEVVTPDEKALLRQLSRDVKAEVDEVIAILAAREGKGFVATKKAHGTSTRRKILAEVGQLVNA